MGAHGSFELPPLEATAAADAAEEALRKIGIDPETHKDEEPDVSGGESSTPDTYRMFVQRR